MKIRSAPMPIQSRIWVVPRPLPNSPYASAAKPRAVNPSEPIVRKRAKRDSGRVAPSRTAAIGGTRVALIAGRRLARSVTRMPTSSETTIVRVSSRSPWFGSVKPTASKSLKRPFASARPEIRPTIDASVPTTRASITIERSTCRREAPSVRIVANSRVRCAIVIESEFAITKLPTKSAMPANASRKPWRKVMNWFVSSASSFACSDASLTSAVGGRIFRMSSTSFSCGTPGAAATAISSSLPSLSKIRCAIGRSKPASVAPPIVETDPNRKNPEMRRRSTGPSPWTPTVWPISKFSLSAVASSIATSPDPGHWPVVSVSGLKTESPLAIEKPRFGAPP